MLDHARLDLRLIHGDGRSNGKNVEKSICARKKTALRQSFAGIPAQMKQISWPLNGRSSASHSGQQTGELALLD
jgi:hypothetical protein